MPATTRTRKSDELAERRKRANTETPPAEPEPAADGDDKPPADPPPAATDTAEPDPLEGHLLDPAEYESEALALPRIDGEGVDKIAVAFTGRVLLDRSNPADVELMRRMKLGSDVTLRIEGKVSRKGHGFTTNKDGDLDAVVYETAVKVETVYRPAAEEL